jgi:hypothetical protein
MEKQLTLRQQAFENEFSDFEPQFTGYHENFNPDDIKLAEQYATDLNKSVPKVDQFGCEIKVNNAANYVREIVTNQLEIESGLGSPNMASLIKKRLSSIDVSDRQLYRIMKDDQNLMDYPSPKINEISKAFPTLNTSFLPQNFANHLVASNEDIVNNFRVNRPDEIFVTIPEFSELNQFTSLIAALIILRTRFTIITPHTDFKEFDCSIIKNLHNLFTSQKINSIGGAITKLYTIERAVAYDIAIINETVEQELILSEKVQKSQLLTRVTGRINPDIDMKTSGWIYSTNPKQIESTKVRLQKLLTE